MSHRPSFTTCHRVLRLGSLTGTAWLAHSAVTVMTYLDGIDAKGVPHNTITAEDKGLVKLAEQRELENEKKRYAKEGRDWEVEKQEEQRREAEKRRVEEEDKKWWSELIGGYDDEKKRSDARDSAEIKGATEPSLVQEEEEKDGIKDSASRSHTEGSQGRFAPFDPKSVPPGNLWPLFPSIGGMPSAHIDPWNALGPRSSSRRKWTEAQEHYKQVDRGSKKK